MSKKYTMNADKEALYKQALLDCYVSAEKLLAIDPNNEEFIAVFKHINGVSRRIGLPYIFPAGLGSSQSIDGIEGFLSKGDLEALKYCALTSKGKGVNIGVFDGLSAYFLAKMNPDLEVFGVDAYLGMNSQLKKINKQQIDIAKQNLSRLPNAYLIVGLSADVARNWNDEIGFLFIDGDHSVNGAKSDFHLWSPFVSFGGLIAVHDAYSKINETILKFRQKNNWHGPDVVCQIMESDPAYEFVMVSGCTEVWKKKSEASIELKNDSIRKTSSFFSWGRNAFEVNSPFKFDLSQLKYAGTAARLRSQIKKIPGARQLYRFIKSL